MKSQADRILFPYIFYSSIKNSSQEPHQGDSSNTTSGSRPQTGSKSTTTSNSDNEENDKNIQKSSTDEEQLLQQQQQHRTGHAEGVAGAVSSTVGYPIAGRPTALSADALAHLSCGTDGGADGSDESSFGAGNSASTAKTKILRRRRKKSNSKKSPASQSSATTPTPKLASSHLEDTPTFDMDSEDIFEIELEGGVDAVNGVVNGVEAAWSTDEEAENVGSLPPSSSAQSSMVSKGVMAAKSTSPTSASGVHIASLLRSASLNDNKPALPLSRSLPQDVAAICRNGGVLDHASGNSLAIDAVAAEAPAVATSSSAKTRPVLVNDIRAKIRFGYTSDNKGGAYSLGDTPVGDLHPFSDGDLTPPMGSPLDRPFSPQSDSELLDRPSYLNPKSENR